jgi:hypothetical protein
VINTTRRQALIAITQLIASTTLMSCSSDASKTVEVSDLETLASVSYDLFPHQSLPYELYIEVAQRLLALDDSLVTDGLASLHSASDNQSWIDVPEAERIEILTAMEQSGFFALLRSTTIDVIYKTPEMFDLVGYGGSAIEQGGYINRGFDDITWIEAVK